MDSWYVGFQNKDGSKYFNSGVRLTLSQLAYVSIREKNWHSGISFEISTSPHSGLTLIPRVHVPSHFLGYIGMCAHAFAKSMLCSSAHRTESNDSLEPRRWHGMEVSCSRLWTGVAIFGKDAMWCPGRTNGGVSSLIYNNCAC